MHINVWKSSATVAARAALRRSARSYRAIAAPITWTPLQASILSQNSVAGLAIGRVQGLSTMSYDDEDRPPFKQLAEQLRNVDITKHNRDQVVDAIQLVAITGKSTDQKESQALDLVESDVLEALLGFVSDKRLADFHVPAYLALIRVTAETLVSEEVLRLNGAEIIAQDLLNPDPRLQAAACLTLGNLALAPTAANRMASPDVVNALFTVLESPHEAIKRTAVTTVATIAGTSVGRDILAQPEHVIALCDLLSGDHSDELRGAVAFALGNILSNHNADAQDSLRESGALGELVLMLSPAFAEDVCSSAAWAIHHGVHLNHDSQSMVVEAGALPLLFQHAFSDSESLQTNALLALESATVGHEENAATVRNNTQAVELLQALQENADDELDNNAKRALNALLQQIE